MPFHFLQIRHELGDEAAMRDELGEENCTFIDYVKPTGAIHRIRQMTRHILKKLGISRIVWPYRIDEFCSVDLAESVKNACADLNPTTVQVTYVFFSRIFDCFGADVRKLLDTHDVFADRHHIYRRMRRPPEWWYTTRAQEAKGIGRADCVMAIQERERAHFAVRSSRKVVTVGHIVDIVQHESHGRVGGRLVLLGSSHTSNRHGCDLFLNEIWPVIRNARPGACVDLYGKICDCYQVVPEGVNLRGYADNLNAVYAGASIILAPVWLGTGLKIKSIEALGHGKALVCTPAAADGLEDGAGHAFVLAVTPSDFAEKTIALLDDDKERLRLEAGAMAYAMEWNEMQWNTYESVLALP